MGGRERKMGGREGGEEGGKDVHTCSNMVNPPVPLLHPLPHSPPVPATGGGSYDVWLRRSEECRGHLLHELSSAAALHDAPHQRGEPALSLHQLKREPIPIVYQSLVWLHCATAPVPYLVVISVM